MLDIIIPCYNAHETIDRCIGSILCQRVLPSIHVTLVNDGGKSYDEVIKRYSPLMDIQEIGYEENKGPATARNYGLTHTKHDLIMFVDSDDALANPFSAIMLINEMHTDPNNVIVISNFLEEVAPLQFKIHDRDTSFMHGKMYKRAYLEKYNILQKDGSRNNEDVGFNILALLNASPDEKIRYTDFISFNWLFNPDSTVRKDKDRYDRSISFRGFADNLTYVFEELDKRGKGDTPAILAEKVTTMERLYLLFKERTEGFPQFREGNLQAVKNFYHKIYKHIEKDVSEELFDQIYNNLQFKGNPATNKKAMRKFIKSL